MDKKTQAETKVLKSDARRVNAEKRGYTPARGKAHGASETGSSAKLGGSGSSGNKSRHHRYGGFKGTALSVLLAFLMVFSSVGEALAATGVTFNGDSDTFGDILPATKVYIDVAELERQAAAGESTVTLSDTLNNSKKEFNIGTFGTGYFWDQDLLASSSAANSNGQNVLGGAFATFEFKDAAILSDRTKANVRITYSNARFNTTAAYYMKAKSAAGITFNTPDPSITALGDYHGLIHADGLGLHAGSRFQSATHPYHFRVGTEIDVKIEVYSEDGTPVPGDFVFSMTGMTVTRNMGTAAAPTPWAEMPDKDYKGNYFEQVQIGNSQTTTMVVAPEVGSPNSTTEAGVPYSASAGGSTSTDEPGSGLGVGIIAQPRNQPSFTGNWDETFLTGFITEANADKGISLTWRAPAGATRKNNTTTDEASVNSRLLNNSGAFKIDSWTTPGGNIQTTKEGNNSQNQYGLLTDGEVLEPGLYGVARGKTMVYTMTPDNNGYYPKQVLAGPYGNISDVSGDVVKHTKSDGSVYYTYEFNTILEDKEIFVEWAPIPAEVDATKIWDDNSNANDNRVPLTLTLSNNKYLPAQKLSQSDVEAGDSQQVKWGAEAGYTDANGNQVPANTAADSATFPTAQVDGKDVSYWYDNSDYKWHRYTFDPQKKAWTKTATDVSGITDFLPKYEADNTIIDYSLDNTVEEAPEPPALIGYLLSKQYTSSKTTAADDPQMGDLDPDKAFYDWKLTNKEELAELEIIKTWDDVEYYKDANYSAKLETKPAGGNEYVRPDLTYNIEAFDEDGTNVTGYISSKTPYTLTGEQLNTNVWKGVIKDLPVYVNGKKVKYKVTEVQPEGFQITTTNPVENIELRIIRETETETVTAKAVVYDPVTNTSTVTTTVLVTTTTTTYDKSGAAKTESNSTTTRTTTTESGRVPSSVNTVIATDRQWGEEVEFTNDPIKDDDEFIPISLDIKKTERGSTTGVGLEGAQFGLFNEDFTTPFTDTNAAELVSTETDSDGLLTVNFKKPGTYYIKETKAPKGYELDPDNRWTIVVDSDLTKIELKSGGDASTLNKIWHWIYTLFFGNSASGTTATIVESDESVPESEETVKKYTLNATDRVKTASVTATKTWDDKNNQDGKRKQTTLTLQQQIEGESGWTNAKDANGNDRTVNVPINNNQAKFEVTTFNNLPTYKDGKKIKYRVIEDTTPFDANTYETTYEAADDNYVAQGAGVYILEDDDDTPKDQSIDTKNKYEPLKTKLIVEKIWNDSDYYKDADYTAKKTAQAYNRPDVIFDIKAIVDGTDMTENIFTGNLAGKNVLTITGDQLNTNKWSDEITDLPVKWSGGKDVVYQVTERQPAGYTKSDAVNVTPEEKTDTETNVKYYEGKAEITNTPVATEAYTELTLNIKKEDSKTDTEAGLEGAVFSVKKVKDAEGHDVTGTASSTEETAASTGITSFTFKEPGTYEIQETTAPVGYKLNDAVYTVEVKRDDEGLQTITLVSGGDASSGNSVWQWLYNLIFGDTTPSDSIEEIGEGTDKTYTLTVENDPNTANVTVAKTWDDKSDQDGKRTAATLTLQKSLDDGDSWENVTDATSGEAITATVGTDYEDKTKTDVNTFENLPAYEDGKRLMYRVAETDQDSEYYVTYDAADNEYSDENNGAYISRTNGTGQDRTLGVYNKYEPKTTSLEITKKWADGEYYNNAATFDAKKSAGYNRPAVTYTITAKDADDADVTSMIPAGKETLTLNGDQTGTDEWKGTIEGLPLYANGGKLITYTVTETQPTGYRMDGNGSAAYNSTDNKHTKTITNTPVKKDEYNSVILTVKKTDKNTDGPLNGAEFKLFTDGTYGTPLDLTPDDAPSISGVSGSDGKLTVTFRKPGTYYLKETKAPKGYELDENNKFVIEVDKNLANISLVEDATAGSESGGSVWKWLWNLIFGDDTSTDIVDSVDPQTGVTVHTMTVKDDPIKADLEIKKNWDDAQNQDGKRAGSTVKLQKKVGDGGWVDVSGKTGTVATGGDTDTQPIDVVKWEALPAYEDGKLILYRVVENAIPEYSTSYSDDTDNDGEGNGVDLVADPEAETPAATDDVITVTNTHTPEVGYIKVNKIWIDHNNQDGKRPETIDFKIEDDNTATDDWTYTMTPDAAARDNRVAGTYTWMDGTEYLAFPVYKSGQKINYTLSETAITGYTTEYEHDGTSAAAAPSFQLTANQTSEVTVTNTHEPEEVSLTFIKTWTDENNKWGNRPSLDDYRKQMLILTADQPVIIPSDPTSSVGNNDVGTASDTYVYTWEGLQKYKSKSNPTETTTLINYTIREVLGLMDGYASPGYPDTGVSGSGTETEVNGNIPLAITNELQLTSLTVNKVWDDADDQDGLRSNVDAEMVLYMTPEDGQKDKYDTDGAPQAVATDDGWTYTWTDLPVYSGRKRVTYSVEETKSGSTANEYTTTYAGNDRTARAGESAGTVTVTNKHVPATVDISITKTWNDSEYLNANARIKGYKRPENITVNITAKIPADEATDPDIDVTDAALTDEQKTVTMTGSATGGTWTYKVEDLPKYHNGKQIKYTMSEEVPTRFDKSGETLSWDETTGDGAGEVTNTPKKDEDELKNTEITLKKTDANGGGVLEGGVFTITKKGETPDDDTPEEITTGEDGTVTYTFTTDGTYTIEEKTAPTGYEKIDDTFTVTVTKELTEIKVSDDNENFWHWIYSLLKRITPGEDTNVEAAYDAETNTITYPNPPKRASLKVTKVWDDNNNQDGVRPGNVGISITGTVPAAEQGADPVPVASVAKDISLNTNNADTTADKTGSTWSNTYDNLPIYYNGQQITYKIVEDIDNINTYVTHGDNYAESYITQTSVLNEDDAVELKVKNTRTPETTKLTINKVWADDKYETGDPAEIGNMNAYTRPDDLAFDITATANNDSVDLPAGKARTTLTEADEDDEDSHKWSTTVTELPVYDGGYPITYAVSEVIPTDYTCEVTEAIAKDAETGEWSITVKNTPKEEDVLTPTTIMIKKTDAKTDTGTGLSGGVFTITSPTGVTANVTTDANGEATYDLNATGDWTVKETTAPTGYVVNAETYTFIVDRELTEIKQKSDKSVWQWLYDLFVKTFYKNSTTGSSSWDEDTNTLTVPNEPDTTSLTVDKKWVDGNNQDGIRVNTLPFTLKEVDAEGNQIDVDTDTYTTVTPDQTMSGIDTTMPDNRVSGTVAWDGVPMYRDGKLIKYAVVEDTTTISEYTASYSDDTSDPKDNVGDGITLVKNPGANDNKITVTNTYTPKTIDIQVKKVWDDEYASAEARAAALANLKADIYLYESIEGNERRLNDKTRTGAVTSSIEDNEVVYTFEDLPVNSDGKVITYRIEEGALSGYESSYSTTYTKKDDSTYGPDEAAEVVAGDVKLIDGADATVTITNTERLEIEVTKEWVDGAIANTEFQLWRTTTQPSDDDYTTGTKTTNPGTAAEKTETTRTWRPGSGWEQVTSHIFLVNDFTSASSKTYKFTNLPKYDEDGNLYYYRVFEPTDEDDLFAAYQVNDTKVKNTNMYSSSGVVELNVVKEIEGRAWLDDTFTGANKNKDKNSFWFEIVPIKSIDEDNKTYEDFDENDPDDVALKNAVPMPARTTAAADLDHPVGAIGRNVAFDPIIITSANTQGGTTEYFYKVYEVADSSGQSLDDYTDHTGEKDGIEYEADSTSSDSKFVPTVHILKIVASDDGTGNITATPYWDYSDKQGAVPVITNKYDAEGDTTAYLVKRIDGRDYKSGDEFKFEVINVAGSVVRATPDAPGSTQANQAELIATINDSLGSYVGVGPNYLVTTGTSGDTKALKANIQNYYKLSDLTVESDNIARGTFIYEIVENDDKATEDPSSAADNDLKFDDRRVYLKVDVKDNLDGTLKTTTSYWRDAACTKAMDARVLVKDEDGSIASAGVQPGATGYTLTNAAFFENEKFSEIVVKKKWVDSEGNVVEPTDNAVIRLNRYKVEDLDRPGDLPTNIDLWENVQTHTFDRGDYYTAVIGSKTYTQTEAARAVAAGEITEEAFNGATWTFNEDPATYTFTNLPLHMTDANGKDWWYIYRVREATDSDAFEASYSTDDGATWLDSWTKTGNMRDGELVIKNTLKASNTANIAAVKQLMGRDWLDTMPDDSSTEADRYNFQLVPIGIGTYDKNGKLIVGTPKDIPDGYKYDDSHTVKRISDDNLKQDTAGVIAPNMPAEAVTTGLDEDKAQANINTDTVGVGERLARFGSITYDMSDLIYDPGDGHMQGDFFYLMKEIIPDDALMLGNDGKTTSTKYSDVKGTDAAVGKKFKLDGVTYDGTVHTVHVKVRENRTEKLTVQVTYDEKTVGDVSTGTQFTPVYTNYYDAEGLQDAKVDKYIMGRDWADNDSFVFDASPLGGAPFADEDGNPIKDDVKLTITKDDLFSGKTYLEKLLPKLHFALSDLPYTVGANGAKDARDIGIETGVTYKNGTAVKEGMKYGRFVYSLREESSAKNDLNIDKDTEYIRVTVIDKGDGKLDTSYKIYEDRYCTTVRKDSEDPSKDATAATFVNQLKRNLTVTKTWTSTASDTVTLRLQWSFDGEEWNDADGTSWLAGIETVKTITQAEYNSGTVSRTFSGLPAYANVPENISNLDDRWVYYRVVENPIADVDTRYSTVAHVDGDKEDDDKYSANPISTEAEKKNNTWNSPRITQTYVVNFPEDLEGEASVNVVKQFTGRSWTNETFTFEIIPVSNTVDLDVKDMPLPYNKTTQQTTKEATVSTNDTRVSTDEHRVSFDPIIIKLSQLKLDTTKNIAKGEFVYTIKEKKPEGAREYTVGTGTDAKTYWIKDSIKYTAEEHTVKIVAINDGSGKINTTVSYDDRESGDFVPVYTNEALLPTPVSGTKTWIGGEDEDHDNASLNIVLERKLRSETEWTTITADEIGRTLEISWDHDKGDSDFSFMVRNDENELVNPVLDLADDNGGAYEYRLRETNAPDRYDVSYDTTENTHSALRDNAITNTSNLKDDIEVTKTWDDAQDASGLRPKDGEVTVHLYRIVTTGEGQSATSTLEQVDVEPKEINKTNTTASWEDLPVYGDDGEKIKYVVLEESVSGYTSTYSLDGGDYKNEGDAALEIELDGNKNADPQTIDIKNSLSPATSTVKVTKKWYDNDNNDGKRPDQVTFKLYKYVWDPEKDNGQGKPKGGYGDKKAVSGTPRVPLVGPTGRPATEADVEADKARKTGDTMDVDHLVLDGTATEPANTVANETASTDENTWKGEWVNLPLTENGKTIIYVVEEETPGSHFDDPGTEGKYSNKPCISGDQLAGYTVKNVYTPMTVEATITKNWIDNNNRTRLRPETLNLQLWRMYDDAEAGEDPHYVIEENPVTKDIDSEDIKTLISADDQTAANTWSTTIDNLPKYTRVNNKSYVYIYFWSETIPAGYSAAASANNSGKTAAGKMFADNNGTLTNTYDKTNVSVTKKWVDSGTNKRTAADDYADKLTLKADGTPVTGVTPSVVPDPDGKTYTVTWSDLPMFASGETIPIVYTVEETAINGYNNPAYANTDDPATDTDESTRTDVAYNKGVITNTQKINVDVKKQWNDKNNHEGRRPEYIKVKLFRNGVEYGNIVKLTKSADPAGGEYSESQDGNTYTWTNVWKDLQYADENGVKYNYTAVEIDSGAAWYQALIGNEPMHQILLEDWKDTNLKDTWVFTIDNSYDDETIGFTIDKIWNDGSNVDRLRPAKIYYRLYQDYTDIADADKQIKTLPTNTTVNITGGEFKTDNNGYIEVDTNKDDVTQGTPGRVTIKGLPEYSANGKKIIYSIKEDADITTSDTTEDDELIFGYTTVVDGNSERGVTVTNSHTPGEVTKPVNAIKKITGRKFNADKDEHGFTFKLAVAENSPENTPTPTPDYVTINPTSGYEANIPLGTFRFTGADMLDDNGEPVNKKTFIYNLTEVNGGKTIDDLLYDDSEKTLNITVTRKSDGGLSAAYAWEGADSDDDAVAAAANTFTNRFDDSTELVIRKIWSDDDADGTVLGSLPFADVNELRPDEIALTVTATIQSDDGVDDDIVSAMEAAGFDQDGENNKKFTQVYTLSAGEDGALFNRNVWQKTIAGLPKLDAAGEQISYEVAEEQLPNYEKPIVKEDEGRWIITNVYKRTYFEATKIWDDGGQKHDNATELKLGGKLTLQRTTKENPEAGDWQNVNDAHLHWNSDGELTQDNKYRQSFKITGLPDKNSEGKVYTYRVVEDSVGSDYTTTYVNTGDYQAKADAVYNGGTINNINQGKITIMARKVWEGDSEDKNGREEIKFQLTRTVDDATKKIGEPKSATEGTETYEPIEDQENDNYVVWKDLPTVVDGKEATYDVEEVKVPDGYESVTEYGYDDDTEEKWADSKDAIPDGKTWNNKIRITNTLGAEDISIPVMKKWDDNDNQDRIRPDSVTVRVQADYNGSWDTVYVKAGKLVEAETAGATAVDDLELNSGNNWKMLFKNLPKADTKGKAVSYRVVEMDGNSVLTDGDELTSKESGKKYTVSIEARDDDDPTAGFIVTNSYQPGAITVEVEKKWDGDEELPDEQRIELHTDVIVHLYGFKEGEAVYYAGSKKITMGTDGKPEGKAVWTNVPKRYYNEHDLEWKVVEDPVYGYTGTVTGDVENGFTVTNTYSEPVTEVKVTKEWRDNGDVDRKRPEKVYYQLWKKVGDEDPEQVEEVEAVENPSSQSAGTGQLADWGYQWKNLPATKEVETSNKTTTSRIEYQDVTTYHNKFDDSIVIDEKDWPGDRAQTGGKSSYVYDGDSGKYVNTLNEEEVIDPDEYEQKDAQEDYDEVTESVPMEVDVEEDVKTTKIVPIYYIVKEKYEGTELEDVYNPPVVEAVDFGEFNVINVKERATTKIKATKIWDDSNNQGGARPDHINIILKGNGKTVDEDIIDGSMTADRWEVTFEDLPIYDENGKITYEVEETAVPGYDTAYLSGNKTDGTVDEWNAENVGNVTITNTHDTSDINVKATKVWKDVDGNTLESFDKPVTFKLIRVRESDGARKDMKDDKTIRAGAIGNDLTVEWKNLAREVGGQKVTYTVEEEPIEGCRAEISDGDYDQDANTISIKVTNTVPQTITVTYKEPATFGDKVLQGPTTIRRGENEPKQPSDPVHPGYTFTGWQRVQDAKGNVTYTARYAEIPEPRKVSYVDPKAADGKMILNATLFDGQTAADAEAKGMAGKPANPKHKGYEFVGWVANQDEFGDWILVAKYNEVIPPQDTTPTVSYIDPLTGLLVSERTNDPSSVKIPADPKAKNMQFVGWRKVVDAGGNTIFVAEYACDCGNGSGSGSGKTVDKSKVETGDNTTLNFWVFMMMFSMALIVVTAMIRRREVENGFYEYRGRH